MKYSHPRSREHGIALLSVLAVVATLLVTATATITLTRSELFYAAGNQGDQRAFYISEAGVHRGIAQLEADRAAASGNTGYTYSTSESFGGGTYSISIAQDPLYSDPRRKLIQSIGTMGNQQSTVTAHVVVQDYSNFSPGSPPGGGGGDDGDDGLPDGDGFEDGETVGSCPILFSEQGRSRLVTTVAGATDLFDGEVFSNGDAEVNLLASVIPMADGTVRTRGDFIESGVLSALATVDAELYREGAFVASGLHLDPLPPLVATGLHFSNGADGHGVQTTIAARQLPIPQFARIRRHPNAILVNRDNVPFGSWDNSTNTWEVNGLVERAPGVVEIYFVEGNVDIQRIRLRRRTSLMIAARGAIALQELNILTTNLANLTADQQGLVLLAEDDVYVGRQILSWAPSVTPETEGLTGALAPTETTGLALGGVEILDRVRVYAYSATGEVWIKASLIEALASTRACILAKQNATLAFMASILSTVREVDS